MLISNFQFQLSLRQEFKCKLRYLSKRFVDFGAYKRLISYDYDFSHDCPKAGPMNEKSLKDNVLYSLTVR